MATLKFESHPESNENAINAGQGQALVGLEDMASFRSKPATVRADLNVQDGSLSLDTNSIYSSVFNKVESRPTLVADDRIRMFEGLEPSVKQHFEKMGNEISDAFNTPFSRINMSVGDRAAVLRDMTVGGYLGKNTFEPPMFDSAKAAEITRPYEQQLMRSLNATQGRISQAAMVEQAMQICGNDKVLTALTLANFTKNIAAVERDQAPVPQNPRQTWPENTYSRSQADSVYNRLEKFSEGSAQPLSKMDETGSIYHFYGAILASSAGLDFMVSGENAIFGWKRDPIKRESGNLGTNVGEKVFGPAQQMNDAAKSILERF